MSRLSGSQRYIQVYNTQSWAKAHTVNTEKPMNLYKQSCRHEEAAVSLYITFFLLDMQPFTITHNPLSVSYCSPSFCPQSVTPLLVLHCPRVCVTAAPELSISLAPHR